MHLPPRGGAGCRGARDEPSGQDEGGDPPGATALPARSAPTAPTSGADVLTTRAPRPGLVRRLLGQAALLLGVVLVYSLVRGHTDQAPGPALAHARDVMAVERRLGLLHEAQLQRLVARWDAVMDVLASIYVWGHWPLIASVLLWLAVRHPREYVVVRNALILSCVLALVVYVLYPVAPPRLSGTGMVDTVAERSRAYHVFQPPSIVDQYAALPSMHMGWDVLVAVALFRDAGSRAVRWAAVALPPLMLACIVLTANHWFVDAACGALIALVALAVADARVAPEAPAPLVPRPRTCP